MGHNRRTQSGWNALQSLLVSFVKARLCRQASWKNTLSSDQTRHYLVSVPTSTRSEDFAHVRHAVEECSCIPIEVIIHQLEAINQFINPSAH